MSWRAVLSLVEMWIMMWPAAYASVRLERHLARLADGAVEGSRQAAFALGAGALVCSCALPTFIEWRKDNSLSAARIGLQLVPAALAWTCGWMLLYASVYR